MRQLGKLVVIAAGFSSFGCGAAAAQDEGGITIEVGYDCGNWLAMRPAASFAIENYALGFVDGMAFGAWVDVWGLRQPRPSRDAFFAWLDRHCAGKPLDPLATAAVSFVIEVGGINWRAEHRETDAPR